jgi:cell division protein ZapA (FtsZ GTPase activity inhibitor)
MVSAELQHRQEGIARRCKTEVQIYKDHYLVAANTDPEYLQQLAREVDERMRQAAEANPHLGPLRLAMLALLWMASDVNSLQKLIDEQEQTLVARCHEIERDIEQLLGVA